MKNVAYYLKTLVFSVCEIHIDNVCCFELYKYHLYERFRARLKTLNHFQGFTINMVPAK